MSRNVYIPPLFIIALGLGWLLNEWEVWEPVNWIWPVLLAACGLLAFVLDGLNKVTFVFGPLLMLGSVSSVLRQLDYLSLKKEIPYLVLLLGVLWLLAILTRLPMPEWMKEEEPPPAGKPEAKEPLDRRRM